LFIFPKFRSTFVSLSLYVPEQQKVLRAKRQSRVARDFAMSDFSLTLVLQIKISKDHQ